MDCEIPNKSLTALYGVFLQYNLCCFHKHTVHWVKKDREYFEGKWSFCESGGGVLNSLIKALFLLHKRD